MSEEVERPQGQELAVRPQRQLVADVIPIFDSARFEHYGRIAAVMAQSTLVPQTLRAGSRDEAIANCIQVVEFADRANFSPFAVAQCASVVFGKLMFEGKLVDAMLQTKLGIELNCYYKGARGQGDRRIYVTDATLTEEEYEALQPGLYPFGIKIIDGSVDEWKTFEKGGAVNAMWRGGPQTDDQLAYKGKRTWSRRYKPAVMLGVVADDEVEDFDQRRLEAPTPAPNFVEAPKPPRKPRKAETPAGSNEPGEGDKAPQASQEPAGGAEIVEDAQFEDIEEDRPTTGAADTATGGAQAADPEPDTSASAGGASEASQEQMESSQQEPSQGTGDGSVAPRDAAYILTTDEPGEDGKVPVYINGVESARAKPEAKACPDAFDQHPGPAVDAEEQEEEDADFDDADPVSDAIKAIRTAKTFEEGEEAMKALAAMPGFKENVADDRKRGVRLALWTRYTEPLESETPLEPHMNFTLMRLFLEFGAKSGQEIDVHWPAFYRTTYRSVNESNQRAINDLMVKRKQELAEARS